MLASAAFPAFLLTAAGFALFLIVSLSAPHIDHIYLLRLTTAGGASKIDLGVFGFCVEGMTASCVVFCLYIDHTDHHSLSGAFTGATSLHDGCSKAQVAYTLPDILFGSLKIDGHDIVKRGLTGALVINPVASGLALISLVFAFFAWVCASRIMEIVSCPHQPTRCPADSQSSPSCPSSCRPSSPGLRSA